MIRRMGSGVAFVLGLLVAPLPATAQQAGKLPLVASPMRFSETPLEYRLPPPLLGCAYLQGQGNPTADLLSKL